MTDLFSTTNFLLMDLPDEKNVSSELVSGSILVNKHGGMRKKGWSKYSYELINGRWHVVVNEEVLREVRDSSLLSRIRNYALHEAAFIREKDLTRIPLVTIVTVVFNGQKYLEDAIRSVINQTYPNIEYIVIDGGSADETMDIILKYDDKIDYWISEKDDGIYDAMNKGIKHGNGEIIGIMNSDDWLEDNAVESVVRKYNADMTLSLIYGAMNIVDQYGNIESTYGSKEKVIEILATPFNHPTCFFRKTVYDKIGLFDQQFKTAADYDLMLRFKKSKMKYCYIDMPISNFRKVGVTSKSMLFPAGQIWRVLRKNGYGWHHCLAAIIIRSIRVIVVALTSFPGGNKLRSKVRVFLSYHRKT